jgi:hypothetical protein
MKIIFVYNAEAGFLNGMMDSVHKIVSPSTYECSLCAITHGSFTMDKSWRSYLRTLPLETVFHHREDFRAAYPEADVALPAILLERDGVISTLISAEGLSRQTDVNGLIATLTGALSGSGIEQAKRLTPS